MATRKTTVSAATVDLDTEAVAIKAISSYLRRVRTRLSKLSDALKQSRLAEAEIEIKKYEVFTKYIEALAEFQGISPMRFFSLSQDVYELTI